MKKVIIFLCLLATALTAAAQPSWVKKNAKALFRITTFDNSGNLLSSANGMFVSENGECISSYQPFKGASRATVIDAKGNEYPVEAILGANDTYDVVKFRVAAKKTPCLAISQNNAEENSDVWMIPQKQQKQVVKGTVTKTEKFGTAGYAFYTIDIASGEENDGMPIFNEAGDVLALMLKSMSTGNNTCYAVSALFADSLKTSGLSINDPALKAINIKKALPTDVNQALLTLFIAGQATDSAAYVQLVDDFIVQFPDNQDGYEYRARIAAGENRFADADRDMEKAIKVAAKPDEAHFSYSRMIYQKVIYAPKPEYESWTLDHAMEEAKAAYEKNPLPAYLQQQAYILYAQKKYDDASELYKELTTSSLRSPEVFSEASRCRLMAGDTVQYMALLDSAVSLFSRPYLKEAAPYILARAEARLEYKKYRDATNDLNEYEKLMAAQVNDSFYYLRFQAETGGRLFQQALNDIAKAISMNPSQELYYAEKASLEVRVGLYDEAIATAEECIKTAPQYSDGYLFLGLAQCMKGKKAEGVKNLTKAKELGDSQADALIEKYGK